ncbi:MAG: tetratricopeptide repeat protein [Parachlamydiales bacterium]|nr:tetratricopeptide repeat protein [Parachlamydiales bacterium]
MEKIKFISFLLILVILTTISYIFIQPKWVAYRKAENYLEEKRYEKALNYYVKAIKKGIDPDLITKNLHRTALIVGDYPKVIKAYEDLIKKHPDDEDLIVGLGTFYIYQNEVDKAIKLYEEALLNTTDYKIKFALAKAYLLEEKYSESIRLYKEIFASKDFDIEFDLYMLVEYARTLVANKDFEMAEKIYLKIIHYRKEVRFQIELANVYLQQKKFKSALAILKKVSIRKLDDHSKLFLADLYAYSQKYEEAKKIYENYLRKYPDDNNAKLKYSKMLIWSRNPKKAIEILSEMKSVYINNNKALLALARAYYSNREYDQAIEIYKHIIHRQKKKDYKVILELGDIYILDKKIQMAIKTYKLANRVKPNNYVVLKKLAIAYFKNSEDHKSLQIFTKLYEKNNQDVENGLGIVRIYLRKEKFEKAESFFGELLVKFPHNLNVCLEYANYQALIGHALKSKNIFLKLLKQTNFREDIYVAFADSLSASKDFYFAENIYKEVLQEKDDNPSVKAKLAYVYASSERYEEAKKIYKMMIFNEEETDYAYMMLARVHMLTKEYEKAYFYAKKSYQLKPILYTSFLIAEILYNLAKYDEALDLFIKIDKTDENAFESKLFIAKCFQKLNQNKIALVTLNKILNKEQNPEASFRILEINGKIKNYENFLKETISPIYLKRYAELYSERGYFDIAIKFYKKALILDPSYFYAEYGIAQMNAVSHNYDIALNQFEKLSKKYVDNYIIMLSIARIYAWENDFEKAFIQYEKMLEFSKNDPVIIKEMAEAASWVKKTFISDEIYSSLLIPAVDDQLLNMVLKNFSKLEDKNLVEDLLMRKDKTIYCNYEKVQAKLKEKKYRISKKAEKELEKILIELSAIYEIQKSVYLEKESKWTYYQKRFTATYDYLEELVAMHPYNQEALFDLAQVQCILGLCCQSRRTYEDLLQLEPLHKRAEIALKRNKIIFNPFLELKHKYYREEGRGDIDRIIQNKTDFDIGIPIRCNHKLIFSANRWSDEPTYTSNSQILNKNKLEGSVYPSYGYTIEYDGVISKYIKMRANFIQKFYLDDFKNTNEGLLNFSFNLNGYVDLAAGFDQANKLDNIFSLRQRIQTKTYWMSATSILKTRMELKADVRSDNYSDNNSIDRGRLDFEYTLTSYPKVFKIGFYGEYRDTRKLNIFVYQGPFLVNIIHPYWTPRNYNSFRASIEWYHNISNPHICSNQNHYYSLKLLSGSDTEKNPTITFEGEWYYGIGDNLTFNIRGNVHRSKIWNSESIWGEIKYQF